jgi:uncharacterized phage protein (TIGR01671 family)
MREILFRGQNQQSNEWVYGFYYLDYPHKNPRIIGDDKTVYVIPETVGQYTGLIDNNGVKIFEGDIVCINRNAPSEKYNRGFIEVDYGAYVVTRGGDLFSEYLYDFSDKPGYADVEIIGNIHDNPELLVWE